MSKIIARQLPEERTDFTSYFDGDGFKASCGDEKYAIYIPAINNRHIGFNEEEYAPIVKKAKNFIEDIDYLDCKQRSLEALGSQDSCQSCEDFTAETFPSLSQETQTALIEWARNADVDDVSCMAEFLTLTTGKEYDVENFTGYVQGSWCEVIYCKEAYSKESIEEIGKMWLGCGYEYIIDDCCGYFVTDTVQRAGGEVLVNKLADIYGCKPENLQVEIIKNERTVTNVEYECITKQENETLSVKVVSDMASNVLSDIDTINAFFEQSSKGGKSAPTLSIGQNKERILANIDCAIENLTKLKHFIENDKIVDNEKTEKPQSIERE